jgi:integrase/recombinase XerC
MDSHLITAQTNELTLESPIEFAQMIFNQLDVSETTREDYKYRINMFLDFVKENGFTHNTFLEFKRSLANRSDLSISTKNKYLATAKIFLKEMNRQGKLPTDITQNIKTFTQDKKHKKDGVNDEEMSLLVEKLQTLEPTPQNLRLKAIFSLLALQGLRQIEIVRLDVKDLDLVSKTASVLGKGRDDKERVSLHPETVKALREYLRVNKIASGALFTSISHHGSSERLTTRSLRRIVTGFINQLGIEKSTHGFRHFFTTTLIKTYKGDLLEVAQYTRHRGLEMLQVYNDAVKKEADLPRYYDAFKKVSF